MQTWIFFIKIIGAICVMTGCGVAGNTAETTAAGAENRTGYGRLLEEALCTAGTDAAVT